jgi:hypothetical protein
MYIIYYWRLFRGQTCKVGLLGVGCAAGHFENTRVLKTRYVLGFQFGPDGIDSRNFPF